MLLREPLKTAAIGAKLTALNRKVQRLLGGQLFLGGIDTEVRAIGFGKFTAENGMMVPSVAQSRRNLVSTLGEALRRRLRRKPEYSSKRAPACWRKRCNCVRQITEEERIEQNSALKKLTKERGHRKARFALHIREAVRSNET